GVARGEATLLGLWSDGEAVHLALHAEAAPQVLVVSLPCPTRSFPSVAVAHPPALRLERTIRDLYGLEPEDSPDQRPWLDHARRGVGGAPPPAVRRSRHEQRTARPMPFKPRSARRSIRSQWAPCTPASSSPATSALAATVRPWCVWRSDWAMCTRASTASCAVH